MKMKEEIRTLADRYAAELKRSIDARVTEMDDDDRSHVLIYAVLGVSESEGKLIDVYQNKGRFLYKLRRFIFGRGCEAVFQASFPRFRVDQGDEYARATSKDFRDRLSGGRGRSGDQVA